MGSEIGV